MTFARPLAIIFHYRVQFVVLKRYGPDMGPNTILKI